MVSSRLRRTNPGCPGALVNSQLRKCRPRQRGDRPAPPKRGAGQLTSSPPARGSSDAPALVAQWHLVVPASAGIVRPRGPTPPRIRRRPRQRGDRPSTSSAGSAPPASSPPARGSSERDRATRARITVVPASAGIVPWASARDHSQGGRPRQRGDRPRLKSLHRTMARSSPPAPG